MKIPRLNVAGRLACGQAFDHVFRGTGIQDNLADTARKLGIPVWKFGAG